jgi:hypothetical protein
LLNSATVSNSQQIDSAKFGDLASFSSVTKAQARHLPARNAAKKDVHARAQARLPDLPGGVHFGDQPCNEPLGGMTNNIGDQTLLGRVPRKRGLG